MRADRLISLMLMLHARGRMTAHELAATLEVSERTIYRDLDALSSAGIPVYAQSGTNGGVFLDENYRVSLTGLSIAEVQALFVSKQEMPLRDLGLAKAVEATLLKLFAALPTSHKSEVERLRQRLHIDTANWFQLVEPSPFFAPAQQAVWEDRRIGMTYQPYDGTPAERVLDAYALVAKANIWYVVGRKPDGSFRNYRLARIQNLALLDEHFERHAEFDLAAYWEATRRLFETPQPDMLPTYPALLRVAPSAVWYFATFLVGRYEQISEPDVEGCVLLRVQFESFTEAQLRVLGLGAGVRVVEPEELRERVIANASAVLAAYETTAAAAATP